MVIATTAAKTATEIGKYCFRVIAPLPVAQRHFSGHTKEIDSTEVIDRRLRDLTMLEDASLGVSPKHVFERGAHLADRCVRSDGVKDEGHGVFLALGRATQGVQRAIDVGLIAT